MELPFRAMSTPLPRARDTLFQAMEPLYQGMRTHSARDGNPFPEGWEPLCPWIATAQYEHFQRERYQYAVVAPMKGRRQNASSTAVDAGRKASATGGRTPTCRENHSILIRQLRLELLRILDLTTKNGYGAVVNEPTTRRSMQSTAIVPSPVRS